MSPTINELTEQAAEHSGRLIGLCRSAGDAIMEVYGGEFHVESKPDSSPLTEADRKAHHIIADGLAALPGVLGTLPVLSEEGGLPDAKVRAGWSAWWLVDPLDGTREFVKRNGEFTVNIALIIRERAGGPGIPAAGWVYAPVTGVQYEGIAGHGARRISAGGGFERGMPGGVSMPVSLPAEAPQSPPRIVASRSHRTPETDLIINAVAKKYGAGSIVSSGSSLKLCRIAEGSAELYPRPAPTMEWDTAAADAVCRAAGAKVIQAMNGEPLEYGKENLLNPWFLVGREEAYLDTAVKALADHQTN